MIIGILIGIAIWQLVILAVYMITDQDEEKIAITGMLVPWLLLSGLAMIYVWIRLTYNRKNYSLCSLYGTQNEQPYFYSNNIGIKNKDIDKYFQEGENEYFIRITKNGKVFQTTPYETITSIRKNGFLCQEWVDKNFKK